MNRKRQTKILARLLATIPDPVNRDAMLLHVVRMLSHERNRGFRFGALMTALVALGLRALESMWS